MTSRLLIVAAVGTACVVAVDGCATIASSKMQPGRAAPQLVAVTSEPAGAHILKGTDTLGVTPTRILLRRDDAPIVLRFEKEGFDALDVTVNKTINPALAGDVAFALLMFIPNGFADNPLSGGQKAALGLGAMAGGLAIDFGTGAARRLPPRVHVTLTPSPRTQAPRYDIVITGGRVIDGTGAPARRADVGIKDGRIAAIGTLTRAAAAQTIDAAGLVVAPGFIDVHTHADDLADYPRAENFVRMGVTSIVAGNCGGSALDVGQALTTIRQQGASVNFATLIGHNTVRRAVMGTDNRAPTAGEMAKMKSFVWRAMADGAVGFSTGLQYVPGTYAAAPEIIELARVAANAGGLYASHMRNEGTALEEAVRETIRVGEAVGCPVQISHLKVDSPSRWGASTQALALIDAARARGVQVEADQYAYTAASSTLGIRFPSWALEGGQEKIAERLNDPATWARIKREMQALLAERGLQDLSFAVVASHRADPSLNGLTMKQVASKLKRSDSADAQFEAARDMMLAGGASMVYHFMSDEDVDRIMRHPQVGFASDSSVLTLGSGAPHPRGYGNNARVLGEYVRKRHVLTLEDAVRKMTSLPARHFRFERRGVIATGYAADVVLFDPAAVADPATFEKPHAYATGFRWVLVNGVPVIRDGEHSGARPGEILTVETRR